MKKYLIPAAVFLAVIGGIYVVFSIYDQFFTRRWGGTTEIRLDAGQKFVNYDWFDDNVWTASRPMRPGEEPELITIQEHSRYGILEGKIIIIERKQ